MIRNRLSRSQRSARSIPPVARTASASPLAAADRAFFERKLGQDFSHVRVHTDEGAAAQADAMGARAFTIGNEIVFGEDRYQPGTTAGRRLLAHELTHVAQQSRGGSGSIGAESRAHAAADRVAAGNSVSAEAQGSASTGVYCDDDEKKKEDVTPAPTSIPSPAAAPGGISFGAGFRFPGLLPSLQLTPPTLLRPTLTPPTLMPPTLGRGPYSFPSFIPKLPFLPPSGLTPGAEGPSPGPQLTPTPPPLSTESGPNIDWLPLRYTLGTHGEPMTDQNAQAISDTWEMNKQLLNNFGITDKFKFWFITQEWILNKGMQKQIEDQQARENPNAIDKLNKEFDVAYPDAFKTPMIPIFDLDWFRSKKKK